jgi:endonuclease/exonuclease/phosphatase family metal-dependent hydrolase
MHFKLSILLVLSSLACASSDNGPQARALNVSSFNIRYGTANDGQDHWDMRRQHVLTTIRAEQPHLLGLQEALAFQVDYLAEMLPHFSVVGIGREGGRRGEFSCLFIDERRLEILRSGTFWLSEQPAQVASTGWDAALPRICTWALLRDRTSAAEFLWMNTHFDHRGQLARERSGALIHARLAEFAGLPAIVTGDLNAGEDSAPLIALKGDRLRDSFRVLHPDASDVGTFSGFKGRKDGLKIDYVLCSPEWTVLEASIDRRAFAGRNPSDHFPVIAKLRL